MTRINTFKSLIVSSDDIEDLGNGIWKLINKTSIDGVDIDFTKFSCDKLSRERVDPWVFYPGEFYFDNDNNLIVNQDLTGVEIKFLRIGDIEVPAGTIHIISNFLSPHFKLVDSTGAEILSQLEDGNSFCAKYELSEDAVLTEYTIGTVIVGSASDLIIPKTTSTLKGDGNGGIVAADLSGISELTDESLVGDIADNTNKLRDALK